jgi:hypothetical protein
MSICVSTSHYVKKSAFIQVLDLQSKCSGRGYVNGSQLEGGNRIGGEGKPHMGFNCIPNAILKAFKHLRKNHNA